MTLHLLLASTGVFLSAMTPVAAAHAQSGSPASASRLRNALSIFAFQSAATGAAAQRQSNAAVTQLRRTIDTRDGTIAALRRQLASARSAAASATSRQVAALQAQLDTMVEQAAAEKLRYTEELARIDQEYARERATLLSAGERILASPRGLAALEAYNEGGPGSYEAADLILAELEDSRRRDRIERDRRASEQDRLDRAQLAIDAVSKGRTTVANVIALLERVLEVAPDNADVLMSLGAFYFTVDQNRATQVLERALRLPLQGETAFWTLWTACQVNARVGGAATAARPCQRAAELAASESARESTLGRWSAREVLARISTAYVLYTWEDFQAATTTFAAVQGRVGDVLAVADARTYFAMLSTLIQYGEDAFAHTRTDRAGAAQYVQFAEYVNYYASHVRADYQQLPMVRSIQDGAAREVAKAQFFATRERRFAERYIELVRQEASFAGLEDNSFFNRSLRAQSQANICLIAKEAADFEQAQIACSSAVTTMRPMLSESIPPSDRAKIQQDLALSLARLGIVEAARGRQSEAAAALRAAITQIKIVMASPATRTERQVDGWKENLLLAGATLATLLTAPGDAAEAMTLYRDMEALGRELIQHPDPTQTAHRNLATILFMKAQRLNDRPSWVAAHDQFMQLQRLGYLEPADAERVQTARTRAGGAQ